MAKAHNFQEYYSDFHLKPNPFKTENQFDVFLSYYGNEKLKYVEDEPTTRQFVKHYLKPTLQDVWKERELVGELHIFDRDDDAHGNFRNAVFAGISSLQVNGKEVCSALIKPKNLWMLRWSNVITCIYILVLHYNSQLLQ